MHRIGIMQGRLSPVVGDRIQAFPAATWREEFASARALGIEAIEWVVDTTDLDANPLFNVEGRREIAAQSREHGVTVPVVCADYLMEIPLSAPGLDDRLRATGMLWELIKAAPDVGIGHIEIPLLGPADITDPAREEIVVQALREALPLVERAGLGILLEVGLPPARVAALLDKIGSEAVRINYDMGNSAYFGFDAAAEVGAYGARIGNTHVKDCTPAAFSVPLGEGDVDFDLVFSGLKRHGFEGDFILQTFRPKGEDPLAVARTYEAFVRNYVTRYFDGSSA